MHAFASVGEGLAAAIIFTVPALLFLGGEITPATVFLLGTVGGFLGILMMIPLRRALCVKEHHTLPFPEGTACAKVLVAGDRGGVTAKPVFGGIAFGAVFEFLRNGVKLFVADPIYSFRSLHKATFGYSVSPLLVGIGWLVGIRIAAVMLAGGLLGYMVIIPLIDYFGAANIIAPGKKPIDGHGVERDPSLVPGVHRRRRRGVWRAVFARARAARHRQLAQSIARRAARQPRECCRGEGPVGGERERMAVTVAGAILGLFVGLFGFDDTASSQRPEWLAGPCELRARAAVRGARRRAVLLARLVRNDTPRAVKSVPSATCRCRWSASGVLTRAADLVADAALRHLARRSHHHGDLRVLVRRGVGAHGRLDRHDQPAGLGHDHHCADGAHDRVRQRVSSRSDDDQDLRDHGRCGCLHRHLTVG